MEIWRKILTWIHHWALRKFGSKVCKPKKSLYGLRDDAAEIVSEELKKPVTMSMKLCFDNKVDVSISHSLYHRKGQNISKLIDTL